MQFLKTLAPFDDELINDRKVYIPPSKKKLIIFDLDETLIHCVGTKEECEGRPIDAFVKLKFPGEDEITAGINIRPRLHECLDKIGKHFQMAVFTASDSLYANPVIDLIDPEGKYFAARLYRNNCI